jgi:cytochrome c-type biogenesis protein CcmH/NrfG
MDGRNRVGIGIALLLAASLGVRVWYDRRPLPPISANAADIERRAREEPGSAAAQIDWGDLLRRQGRLDEAESAFVAASRLNPSDARPYAGLALVAIALHQPARAIDAYRQAIQRDPSDASDWSGMAAQYEVLHQQADALPAYEKATQLDPKDADAARQLGLLYTQQGEASRGHDLLARAAQLNPTDLRTQRYLGENAFLLERFTEARQAFEKVLAQEPDNFAVLSMLAQIIVRLDPTPEGLALAERHAKRSIAIKPTGSAHLALGQIYLARRQYAPAITEFKKAIALYPDLLLAYVSLSQAYTRTDRTDLARKADADYQATLLRQKQLSGNVGFKPIPWR